MSDDQTPTSEGAAKADAIVSRYILRKFREETKANMTSPLPSFRARVSESAAHLVSCPDLRVVDQEATNGSYGCDTGCDYARLEADLICSHGMREEYEYGDFGELADMLQEIRSEQLALEEGDQR
ncbi:hypothetical protein ABZ329_29295 [Streptomyces rubiginosohelvolus]|uniref:hypothetical protein n=1 Tax=Streptomyces rubiginosohelvolus TaxID=67362 RepID=UPI0033F0AF4D